MGGGIKDMLSPPCQNMGDISPPSPPGFTPLQLMNVPRVEIKLFDGTAASYMTFMAVLDEVVGNVNITGQAKLTRLLQ